MLSFRIVTFILVFNSLICETKIDNGIGKNLRENNNRISHNRHELNNHERNKMYFLVCPPNHFRNNKHKLWRRKNRMKRYKYLKLVDASKKYNCPVKCKVVDKDLRKHDVHPRKKTKGRRSNKEYIILCPIRKQLIEQHDVFKNNMIPYKQFVVKKADPSINNMKLYKQNPNLDQSQLLDYYVNKNFRDYPNFRGNKLNIHKRIVKNAEFDDDEDINEKHQKNKGNIGNKQKNKTNYNGEKHDKIDHESASRILNKIDKIIENQIKIEKSKNIYNKNEETGEDSEKIDEDANKAERKISENKNDNIFVGIQPENIDLHRRNILQKRHKFRHFNRLDESRNKPDENPGINFKYNDDENLNDMKTDQFDDNYETLTDDDRYVNNFVDNYITNDGQRKYNVEMYELGGYQIPNNIRQISPNMKINQFNNDLNHQPIYQARPNNFDNTNNNFRKSDRNVQYSKNKNINDLNIFGMIDITTENNYWNNDNNENAKKILDQMNTKYQNDQFEMNRINSINNQKQMQFNSAPLKPNSYDMYKNGYNPNPYEAFKTAQLNSKPFDNMNKNIYNSNDNNYMNKIYPNTVQNSYGNINKNVLNPDKNGTHTLPNTMNIIGTIVFKPVVNKKDRNKPKTNEIAPNNLIDLYHKPTNLRKDRVHKRKDKNNMKFIDYKLDDNNNFLNRLKHIEKTQKSKPDLNNNDRDIYKNSELIYHDKYGDNSFKWYRDQEGNDLVVINSKRDKNKPNNDNLIEYLMKCAHSLNMKYTDDEKKREKTSIVTMKNDLECNSQVPWSDDPNVKRCDEYLRKMNDKLLKLNHENTLAEWNFETNICDYTKNLLDSVCTNYMSELRNIWKETEKFVDEYKCLNYSEKMKKEFKILLSPADAVLPSSDYKQLKSVLHEMETIYSTATLCRYKQEGQCNLRLEPDINRVMAESRDPDELFYYWKEWTINTGDKMIDLYSTFVQLNNKAAQMNGYRDASFYWASAYDDQNILKTLQNAWDEIEPLYRELHKYVKRKLYLVYPNHMKTLDNDSIPAHLLGNLWAQTWTNIYDITAPYPYVKLPDLTQILRSNNYTPARMVLEAENFFVSLNFTKLPKSFWINSIVESDQQQKIVCHASAWDMYDDNDFRIKMCAHVTAEDFIIIHHEMGHVYYYMQYKDLPVIYRDGANPGFHEAIGDVIGLSVSTPQHLRKLINKDKHREITKPECNEVDINFLYFMALQKIAFLPFAFIVFQWQSDVFSKNMKMEEYNEYWWKLRKKYQGIEPPCEYITSKHFDPGAKYHVAAGVSYMRYFISFIIQFQFQEALCKKCDTNTPLHQCDIYGNTEAGNHLKKMMSLGSSVSWKEALYILTGTSEMSVKPLLNYFDPLYEWLKKENMRSCRQSKPNEN